MTSEIPEQIESWFTNHITAIFPENLRTLPVIQLKVDHMRHVAQYCKTLAEELHWYKNDILTAEIIGILHDVGRFSQYAEFGTFIDADSVNHGIHGYRIVRESSVLSSLSSRERHIILDGIRYHNDKKFRNRVQPESLPFVKLVRDADKLDKLRVAKESIQLRIDELENPALTISSDGPVNPDGFNQIKAHRIVSKKNILSEVDFRLMQLSLVFDIHYKPTYKHIFNSKVLELITAILPDDREIRTAAESVMKYFRKQIKNV